MFMCVMNFDAPLDNDEILDNIHSFTGALIRNGQIIGRNIPLVFDGKEYVGYFMVPEADSLDMKYCDKFVKEAILRLKTSNINYRYKITGADPYNAGDCKCDCVKSYVLYTDYISNESPVRCGGCFSPIPLYKLPKNSVNILGWEEDYKTLDLHQMHCQTGEKYAIRQMSKHDSSLTKRGLEICDSFLKQTGIPMYYYLYHPKGKGKKVELFRKCPRCNGDWLLEEKIYGFMNFCCHNCRLLSNIAWS